MQSTYEVKNGEIISPNGFPWAPRLFCDNRLMFEVDENAISEIRYFHPHSGGDHSHIVMRKNFYKAFTFFLESAAANYGFLPAQTRLMPYGFWAEWKLPAHTLEFSIAAVKDSLIFTLTTPPDLPAGYRFKAELRQDGFFTPPVYAQEGFGNPLLGGLPRTWQEFQFQDQMFKGVYTEADDVCTAFCICADFPMAYDKKERNIKYILRSQPLQAGRTYRMVLSVDEDPARVGDISRQVLQQAGALLAAQEKRYAAVAGRAPVLQCDDTALANFFALAPMYVENLKLTDCSGALRATTKHYMAWGSDSLYRAYALALWGDNEYNASILDLAQRLGSPLICAYNGDCTKNLHYTGQFDPTDAAYITHLYTYIVGGGKPDADRYAFAKSIFEQISAREKQELGLFDVPTRLHFDYSDDFDTTACDRDVFGVKENGLFYAAVRCMQYLAYQQGDTACMQRAAELARRFERNFVRLCFNSEVGFFPAAVNSVTRAFLSSYCSYLMMYENDYLTDVMEETFAPSLAYFKQNYLSPNGIRPLAVDHPAYDGDGNQMHSWWPGYNADYYARMISMLDDTDCVRQYLGWITYWSDRLTMPEGLECYDDNPEPGFDYWNQCCGSWYMETTRVFYQSVVRSVIGLDFDHGGLTVYPRSGGEYTLTGLHMLGKTFDVAVKGSGKYIRQITVNGTVLEATHKIPMDLLQPHNQIEVQRAAAPVTPFALRSVNGGSLMDYRFNGTVLSAALEVPGHALLKLYTGAPLTVTVDRGQPETVAPGPDGKATVCLELCGRHSIDIQIQR